MNKFFDVVDMNVLIQIILMLGLYLFLRYGKGKIPEGVYTDVKTALMLTSKLFKFDQIKTITDVAMSVVGVCENLGSSNEIKHSVATKLIAENLEKYNISCTPEELDTLVKITVSYLPKTNK